MIQLRIVERLNISGSLHVRRTNVKGIEVEDGRRNEIDQVGVEEKRF